MTKSALCPLGYKHGETEKTKRNRSVRKLSDQSTAVQENTAQHKTFVLWLLVQNLHIFKIQYVEGI